MLRTGARSSRSADAPDAWGIVHKDGCFRGSLAERPLEGEGSGSAPHPKPKLPDGRRMTAYGKRP